MWLASNDTQNRYITSVNNAINNDDDFKTFKSNNNYNCIVGMSENWQAPLFLDFIKNNNPLIFNKINDFKINDFIGSPTMWKSPDNYEISPNTLRYIKTLVDLENNFGSLNNFNIIELGVGYGGLACIINSNFEIKNYVLVDLPIVQQLAQKYLSNLNIGSTITKLDKYDLFISEFCLSEFDDESIYDFYDEFIIKSDRVYLTMNLHNEIRKDRFINKIKEDFNIMIIDEYPKTNWPNYIIIGTKKYE